MKNPWPAASGALLAFWWVAMAVYTMVTASNPDLLLYVLFWSFMALMLGWTLWRTRKKKS